MPPAGSMARPSAVARDPGASSDRRDMDSKPMDLAKRIPEDETRRADFEAARKRFAVYGKQNAHVSHYDSTSPTKAIDEKKKLKKQRDAVVTRSPQTKARARGMRMETDVSTVALKNSMLLQENGELATHLDDIEYHLDGILQHVSASGLDADRLNTMTQSVIALSTLIRLEHVQAVLKVSKRGQAEQGVLDRIRDVVFLLTSVDDELLRLAVAVLAYFLTMSPDVDEVFTPEVIDCVVQCLSREAKRTEDHTAILQANHSPTPAHSEAPAPTQKSCLKRKKCGSIVDQSSDASSPNTKASSRATHTRQELASLLKAEEVFMVDNRPQLALVDILGMVLHNTLQIGGAQSSDQLATKSQRTSRRMHRTYDLAGATLSTILARKKHLIQNDGLATLVHILETRVQLLDHDFLSNSMAPVTMACACAFQRVRTILRVLDQASFLATEVQRYLSKSESIFAVTLKLIAELSELAWGSNTRSKWKSDPSFMHLVVDVILAALRVLINLSHHNEGAAAHVLRLRGMSSLFTTFCKLWGMAEQSHTRNGEVMTTGVMEDKLVFDGYLLILSAITNCIELSPTNCNELSNFNLPESELSGLETYQSKSVCCLLVSFFLSRVQSYLRLIELSESQDQRSNELEGESWVPEDVILGGCCSLLLGYLMKNSASTSAVVLGALPDHSPRLLLRALSAFVALHSQLGALTPEVGKSVLEVEKVLKSIVYEGGSQEITQVMDGREQGSLVSRGSTQEEAREEKSESSVFEQTLVFKLTKISSKGGDNVADGAPSPPASAFKLRKFSKVCTSVDDSDMESVVEVVPQKKTPPRNTSTARTIVKMTATVTGIKSPSSNSNTPNRRRGNAVKSPPSRSNTPNRRRGVGKSPSTSADTPSQRRGTNAKSPSSRSNTPSRLLEKASGSINRLKRVHQLVTDLEAELTKIDKRESNEVSVVSTTSTEEMSVDFSQDLEDLSMTRNIRGKVLASPKSTKRAKRTESTPVVPSLNKSPTSSQKRKLTAKPPRTITKKVTKVLDNLSVFDFPG